MLVSTFPNVCRKGSPNVFGDVVTDVPRTAPATAWSGIEDLLGQGKHFGELIDVRFGAGFVGVEHHAEHLHVVLSLLGIELALLGALLGIGLPLIGMHADQVLVNFGDPGIGFAAIHHVFHAANQGGDPRHLLCGIVLLHPLYQDVTNGFAESIILRSHLMLLYLAQLIRSFENLDNVFEGRAVVS